MYMYINDCFHDISNIWGILYKSSLHWFIINVNRFRLDITQPIHSKEA